MILIDSTYIYSGGGKTLLKYFLQSLDSRSDNFIILCDTRLFETAFFDDFRNIAVINKNEFSRFLFYFKNRNKLKKVFCFSSAPPPFILINIPVIIYFHNIYLLQKNTFISNYKYYLKNLFIKCFSKSNYKWYVQTDLVKNELIKAFKFKPEQVYIMPFFRPFTPSAENKPIDTIKYVYIADSSIHKNHLFLLRNWEMFVNKVNAHQKVELNLTVAHASGILKSLIENPEYLSKNNIYNHGHLSEIKALELLSSSNYLVFVSNFESFGLPLIEACQFGCKVIAPDLDYVNQILIPSLKYIQNNDHDFVKVLFKSTNILNVEFPVLKTENKIDKILNNLLYV